MSSDLDRSQIVQLIDEHYRLVYRFALRLCGSDADAEDLVQQTFMSACQSLGQLKHPEKSRSWLLSITRNAFLKQTRRQRTLPTSSLEQAPEIPCEVPESPVDHEQVQSALAELPEEFRTPLILYYFEELTYRDIAETLNLPVGTVMSRLSRAKEHLRRRLAGTVSSLPEVLGSRSKEL